jgi:hypothetical protein
MADNETADQAGARTDPADAGEETRAKALPKPSFSDAIKTIGGLLAVLTGTVVVAIIAGAAISKNSQTAATIAASTAGAVATIVGAYFGVKIGSDQTKQAIDAGSQQAKQALDASSDQVRQALDAAKQQAQTKDKEAIKAQVYALHVPSEKAGEVQAAARAAQDAA